MNLQQALNNSLLSVAGSAYFTGEALQGGKESAIKEFRDATDDSLKKQQNLADNETPNYFKYRNEGDSHEEAMDKVNNSVSGQESTLSLKRLDRAEGQLKKWAPHEADEYTKLAKRKVDDLTQDMVKQLLNQELPDLNKARVDAKALKSLSQGIETATNTTTELNKRIDTLHNKISHSNINPNPSIRMEVE